MSIVAKPGSGVVASMLGGAEREGSTATEGVTGRQVLVLVVGLLVASTPAMFGARAIAAAASLYPLARSAHPYLAIAHGPLLWFAAPAVAMSACVLLLSPGLLLAFAAGRGGRIGEWVLCGLALSLPVVSVAAGVVQAATGTSLGGGHFVGVVLACVTAAALVAVWRAPRLGARAWPFADAAAWPTLLSMLLVPALLLAVLAPKFFWESFNGDGAHAFESTRLLLTHAFPLWPSEAGDLASFPGISSMLFAFSGSWFMRLFGPVDAAARLPLLLYLPALFGGVLALAEEGRETALTMPQRWTLWLAIVVFAVAMAFSATYSPYSADIALPATQDTLLMVCFLGVVLAFVRGAGWWLGLFVVLTYLSLPSGAILMASWLVAALLVVRPTPRREARRLAMWLGGCVVGAALAPRVLGVFGVGVAGGEYGVLGVLRYLAFLQFTDWHRFVYVAIPCGILPLLMMGWWQRQDGVARALTLVTVVYFLFFFVQAYNAIHHFVPAMVLPLVVHWRTVPAGARGRWTALTAGCALIALAIALPANATPHADGREVGAAVLERIGGYERSAPEVFRHSTLLEALFPYDWDPAVPERTYGGSPLVWNHYARHDITDTSGVNYLLQRQSDPAPAGWRMVASDSGAALFVRSDSVWARHRALRPPTPAGSPALVVPRGLLFRSVPLEHGPYVISVVDVLEGMGFDLEPLLARLGVRR